MSQLSQALAAACLLAVSSCAGPQATAPAKASPAAAASREERPAVAPSAQASAPSSELDEKAPAGKLPAYLRPTHYQLAFDIDPALERFSGTAQVDLALDVQRSVIFLHGRHLHVTEASVEANGARQAAKYEQLDEDGAARLSFAQPVGPGPAVLRFAWDAPFDPQLAGLYVSQAGGVRYASTQMENIRARLAFPCFDEPRFKTPYDVTVTAPAQDAVVGNTLPVEEAQAAGGKKRVRFATTRPLPTYLVALAVGPFDVVKADLPPNAIRKRALPMRGLAPRGRGSDLAFALQAASELLPRLEEYFGSAYPFDKLDHLAIPDFEEGAMENAGAITYRETFLLFTPGKTPEETKTVIAEGLAHEMAHQWFGDLVTVPWWDDIWLNESFATWLSHRIVEQWRPAYQSRLDLQKGAASAMSTDSLVTARKIRQPIESNADIANAFDGLTYEKGGALLSMFERYLGAETFRAGIRSYVDQHADGSGSTDDVLAALSKAAGTDVAAPFKTFIDQAGVPQIEARLACDGGKPSLALQQSRYLPLGSEGQRDRVWKVPVCARYQVTGGAREACTLLEQPSGAMPLPGASCASWVMPNARAAGYYHWALPPADLRRLREQGYARLDTSERLSFAEELRAALRTGSLQAADVLGVLEPIAHDPESAVSTEAIGFLSYVIDRLAGTEKEKARKLGSALFLPVAERLGWVAGAGETVSQRRLREATLSFLAFGARDPVVRREAARRGRALVAGKGPLHLDAVSADLAPIALAVAVQDGGAPVFDRVDALFGAATDADTRNLLLGALSAVHEPALSTRALALSLDPRLRANERLTPLGTQLVEPETWDGAMSWLETNLDAYLKVLPTDSAAYLPAFTHFCDEQHAARVTRFFAPRTDQIVGTKRALANTEERMRLCIAQVEAQQGSAQKFLRAWTEHPGVRVAR